MPRRVLLTCVIACVAAVAHGALQHGDIVIAAGLPYIPYSSTPSIETYDLLCRL